MFVAEAFVVGVVFIYISKRFGVKKLMKNNGFGFCIIYLLIHNLYRDINLSYLFTIYKFGNRWKINDSWENERRKIKNKFCANTMRTRDSKRRV